MKIVLATDGSAHSKHAARLLSHLPHNEPLELTVLTNVFVPAEKASGSSDSWLPEFREEQHGLAREHYDQIAELFTGADVQLRHKIGEGHVGHSIAQEAESIGADMIVLGARGHSAVERILLGSVSEFVATEAKCGVLVVRPSQDEQPQELRVTIAHDNTTESNVALDQFKKFNWGKSVDGYVLSVVPIVRTFRQDLIPDVVFQRAQKRDEATKAVERAVSEVRSVAPRLQPKMIEAEHVGEAILNFANEQGANLIVAGEHERSMFGRLMLGSVSRYILHHATCSVWIARKR